MSGVATIAEVLVQGAKVFWTRIHKHIDSVQYCK